MPVSQRTLWEEGTNTSRQVATLASGAALLVVLANILLSGEITMFFDIAFVVICVASALAVRPHDFFAIGVLPPLLMFGTVAILALVAPGMAAESRDGLIQAVVSGLAHHAGALVVGYGLTLVTLALRQMASQKRLPAQTRERRRLAVPPEGLAEAHRS